LKGSHALSILNYKNNLQQAGTECGLVLEGWRDPKPGDVVECVKVEWVSPSVAEVTEAAAEAKSLKRA